MRKPLQRTLFDRLDSQPSVRSSRPGRVTKKKRRGGKKDFEARILAHLVGCGASGATDEEMQFTLSMPGNSERPRRVDLVHKGLVRASGQTRPTDAGGKATVWIACRGAGKVAL